MDLTFLDPIVAAIRMGYVRLKEVPSIHIVNHSIVDLSFRSSLVLAMLHVMVVMLW